MQLAVFNSGSSSLKVELFTHEPGGWRTSVRAAIENLGREDAVLRAGARAPESLGRVADAAAAADAFLERLEDGRLGVPFARAELAATGHRVVHGGAELVAPVAIDARVRARLAALADLAPLHNPPALAVIDRVAARWPGVPSVAVFDTAFFRDLPAAAAAYAIPAAWQRPRPIKRYGFHGIAHEYLGARHRELAAGAGGRARGRTARVITLQLGHGCSAAALRDGRPVDTSMGFTPLEGLVMGTRPGDLDPGVVLAMLERGESAEALDRALNRESGLLALSGSADVREIVEREARGDERAALALAVFVHRLVKYLGAYAAVLGGVDALVFGGGIGEHSALVRRRACAGLGWLGLALDDARNEACVGAEGLISAASSAIDAWVIPVREERAIAQAVAAQCGVDTTFPA